MRKGLRLAGAAPVLVALTAFVVAPGRADDTSKDGTIKLFNGKDFSGWTIYIDPRGRYSADANGDRVFTAEDGVIHVSGEKFGGLTTKDEYENYRLSVEFKWGEKRWPPREKDKRDSGILVHCVGPDKIWTKSIECQIQEGDCGDFWLVGGTTITVDGNVETNFKKKKKDSEKPNGEWNTVEVVCDGDKITNIVNGVVVNEGTNASVVKGRILLQSEGAEVYYRNVVLTPLKR
jgi:3-keto-disaccharide hydrolase